MKLDFSTKIKELDGNPAISWNFQNGQLAIREIDGKTYAEINKQPITIGGEICKALVSADAQQDKVKMLQLGHLAQRIYNAGEVEITVEEAALIQDVCKSLPILVYTQIFDFIELGTLENKKPSKK